MTTMPPSPTTEAPYHSAFAVVTCDGVPVHSSPGADRGPARVLVAGRPQNVYRDTVVITETGVSSVEVVHRPLANHRSLAVEP